MDGASKLRIGALPLARAALLPEAINTAAINQPALRLYIDDGPYPDLLMAIAHGSLDILIGALREPTPHPDVVQEKLFEVRLGVFCGPHHPLLNQTSSIEPHALGYPWVVPRTGTPTRAYFDQNLKSVPEIEQAPLIETSSMILLRELLQTQDRLALVTKSQVAAEVKNGQLFEIEIELDDTPRAIGITYRKDWHPTEIQRQFVETLRTGCISA